MGILLFYTEISKGIFYSIKKETVPTVSMLLYYQITSEKARAEFHKKIHAFLRRLAIA